MKAFTLFLGLLFIQATHTLWAIHCPDPQTSSLQWGVPPEPWRRNPFSPHSPQADEHTQFLRANILVAGLGRGVLCTYKNSVGEYSIWWEVVTKIPARMDYRWVETLGGFVCNQGLLKCEFEVVEQ